MPDTTVLWESGRAPLPGREGQRKIFADTDPDDAASNTLLASLGFQREDLLRAEWETHIGVRDTVAWGLLADEWTSR